MAYDYYPAVDENLLFSPAVRAANAKSSDFRNQVLPMTTVQRNNLVGVDLWDGRLIVNTDTDRINRYDLGTLSWAAVAEYAEMIAANNASDAAQWLQLGLRNKIRNGDMSVAQRGNGPYANNAYGIDGWTSSIVGAGLAVSRTVLIPASAPSVAALVANMTTACVAAGDQATLVARIEDVRTYSGQSVTLQFQAQTTVAGRILAVGIRQYFGSGGSPSATVDTPVVAQAIAGATFAKYTVTFTVPSVAAKTVGTAGNDYLEIRFSLGAGATNFASLGFANAAQGIQAIWQLVLTDVQLEAGAVATPFERLPQQMQLAWSQRYFVRYGGNVTGPLPFTGVNSGGGTSGYGTLIFPVIMRATPTAIYTSVAGFNAISTAIVAVSTMSTNSANPEALAISWSTTGSPGPVGCGLNIYSTLTTALIDVSSEL
jgi:hypothetical protein